MVKLIQFLLFISVITNLKSQIWNNGPLLPNNAEGRHHPVTFSIGTNGYVGLGNSPNSYTDNFYQYNSTNNTWKELKKFPGGGRGYSIGTSYNGKGYLGFGLDERGVFQSDLWVYDPDNDSWTRLKDCPCSARAHPAFLAMDGKIYAGLGSGSNGDLKDFWVYDITTDSWNQLPDMPAKPRHHPFQFALSSYLYAGMGHGGPVIYKDLFRFDPSTNTWKEMASLPAEGRVAGTQFDYNGRGYILSGQGEDHNYMKRGEFWEYDPRLDSWKELPEHPGTSRWAPGSFVIGTKVYLTCGQDQSEYYSDLLIFDFNILNTSNNIKTQNLISYINNGILEIKSNQEIKYVSILNLMGETLVSFNLSRSNSLSTQIDLSYLPNGIYLVQINKESTQKFVKF